MRGHRKTPVERKITPVEREIEPRDFRMFGEALLQAAQVKLVGEEEWEAADDAITDSYDTLLACKEFLETLQMIAPFHPEMNRLSKRLEELSESVESTLRRIEHYQETGESQKGVTPQ